MRLFGDAKNKNSCAKVDKIMAELRYILRVVSPEGLPLSELDLQKCTETLNTKIRNMNLSAREIMFSRLQDLNANIQLNDALISDSQFENRKIANSRAATKVAPDHQNLSSETEVKLHSLVFLKDDIAKDKTKVRNLYNVTEKDKDSHLFIQKMLHPLTDTKSEINNRKRYRVKIADVYLVILLAVQR